MDYEIVTLDDLLFTQEYLFKIKGEKNDIINKFIISKVNLLNNKGTQIPEFTLEMINN